MEHKLCSKCKLNPPQVGQRWCRSCRTKNQAETRTALPKTENLATLLPDTKNANKGTDRGRKALGISLRDSGAGRSVLIDKNNRLIAGNKTVEAAAGIGMKKVRIIDSDGTDLIAVRRTDLNLETDAVAQKLAIADNRIGELSLEWDGHVMQGLSEGGLDLSDLFTAKELGAITAGARGASSATDEVPDLPPAPVSRLGDIYLLGRHRLLCGDSTIPENITLALDGLHAHMAWTDPPYNVAYVGKTADALTIQSDSMSADGFAEFMDASMAALSGGLYPGACVYVAHSDSWGHVFRSSFLKAGLLLKEVLIWAKDAFVMGRQDYHWQHEPILYGFKEAVKLEENPTETPAWQHEPILYGWKPGAAHNWYTDRRQSTILSFARPKRSAVHPTMKPVALVEYCIRNSSKEGDIILEPFGGSGTTLMACEASGRTCISLELDPAYVDVIVQRFEEHTGQKAKLLRRSE
jgi:DNA modification methylase